MNMQNYSNWIWYSSVNNFLVRLFNIVSCKISEENLKHILYQISLTDSDKKPEQLFQFEIKGKDKILIEFCRDLDADILLFNLTINDKFLIQLDQITNEYNN